jgi:hypothetical protein
MSTLTAEAIAQIIALVAEGKSARKACDEQNVAESTFRDAVAKDDVRAAQYAHAREARGLALAEQALEIADDLDIPADHKRLMLDARKWFASKLNPKQLGEKLDLNHGGGVDLRVTAIDVNIIDPTAESAKNSAVD